MIAEPGEPAVHLNAQLLAWNVVARQVSRPRQIDRDFHRDLRRLLLERPHRVFEKLTVQFVTVVAALENPRLTMPLPPVVALFPVTVQLVRVTTES